MAIHCELEVIATVFHNYGHIDNDAFHGLLDEIRTGVLFVITNSAQIFDWLEAKQVRQHYENNLIIFPFRSFWLINFAH